MPLLHKVINTLDNLGGSLVIKDFGGGLNTEDSNEILKNNEAIICSNWEGGNGYLIKVNGHTKKNSTLIGAKPVRGLFRAYQSDGTSKLIAICNSECHYSDNDGTTFTREGNSTAYTEADFFSGVNYNDKFFFTGKTENLHVYNIGADTSAAATNQPTDPCQIVLKRSDRRLITLVNGVNGSTLYFSKVDPTGAAADDWSASNDAGSIAIDGAKSEALTGGMTFGAVDIIFKDYAAFKVWGYPTPQAIRMPGSPGCAAPYSVSQGDGLGFFLSHDAVWMYDGTQFIEISSPIQGIISDINPSYIQNTFGVYRNGLYRLFYTATGKTTNQDCVIYDVGNSNPYQDKNIWHERPGLKMNCPVVFTGTGDDGELLAGTSQDTGFVYRLDFSSTGDDAGSDIEAINQTKYFDMKYPNLVKRYSKIYIRYYSAQGDLLINWYTDRGNTTGSFTIAASQTGTKLGVFVLDTDKLAGEVESVHIERLPDTCIGKDISIKITHDDSGVAPIIRSIELEFESLYIE